MSLTLRRNRLSPPAYRGKLDYTVFEDGRAIGRIYEDRRSLPELRWFWSITRVFDNRMAPPHGRAPTLKLAKVQFWESWEKCRASAR